MSTKRSDEERILAFFSDAHVERAAAVFQMVKATMKRRLSEAVLTEMAKAVAPKRRKRRTKAEIEAAKVAAKGPQEVTA